MIDGMNKCLQEKQEQRRQAEQQAMIQTHPQGETGAANSEAGDMFPQPQHPPQSVSGAQPPR